MGTTNLRLTQDKSLSALPERLSISDEDIYEAMKKIQGYLDITPGDFKELYQLSYRHAIDRLTNTIRAKDIMTREVVSVTPSTPLHEVANRMAEASISGVPVLDEGGRIVGIVSEQDFLKHMGARNRSFMSIVAACLQGKGCAAISVRKGLAADIMKSPVVTIDEDATLVEIAAIMSKKGINRLPVVAGETDAVVGILTRGDLIRTHIL
ncbi:MAG: CBS domain-containing protein [Pseudomonadota bacterium]